MENTQEITMEQLAAMVNEGFAGVTKEIGEVKQQLGKIEKIILADYGRRIEALENEIKRLKDVIAI